MAAKSSNPPRPGRCEGEERKKALSVALANIEKQFGKGAIMRMADGAEVEDIETVSTGSLGLDLALGVGGPAPRAHHRSVRPGVIRQDDAHPAGYCRNAEDRRHLCLH